MALGSLWIPRAASADSQPLGRADFLARVRSQHPELDLLAARRLRAQAGIAAERVLPPVTISYEQQEVFSGGQGFIQTRALSAGWSIDISGRRGLRIDSSRLAYQSVEKTLERERDLLVLAALEIYDAASRARLRAESLRRSRPRLAELVGKMKRRVAAGDASGYDLSRFELLLTAHDARIARAEAEQRIVETQLGALVDEGGPISAADDLSLPRLPAAAARSSRADLEATRYERRSGQRLLDAASRWWVPTLELSAGYMSADLGPGAGPGTGLSHGYTAMLSATVPLFSRGRAERTRGQAQIRRADAERKRLQRYLSAEVVVARERLRSSIARAEAFRTGYLPRVAGLVSKAERAYGGGEASSLELQEAYQQATDAALAYIDLEFQCRLAELSLWRATGVIGGSR